MGQVSIRLGGFSYTVGCRDGEERHLQAMAAQVDKRIARIRAMGGQGGEARTLALAALLMADEIHDLTESRLPAGSSEMLAKAERAVRDAEMRRKALALLAERAEAIATELEAH